MRLSNAVIREAKKAGVTVFFADRRLTKLWNRDRSDRSEPAFFGGWYWHRTRGNVVVDYDDSGPFKSESAAVRDAYTKLQLRVDT